MLRELLEMQFHPRVPEAAVAAGASGGAAVAASFADVSVQVVGVPLPVLMAAAAGAFVVIAFAEMNAPRAAAVFLALLFAGCAGAPLLETLSLWGARKYLDASLNVPGGMRAFAALAIAAAPYWLPKAWPYVQRWLPGNKGGAA